MGPRQGFLLALSLDLHTQGKYFMIHSNIFLFIKFGYSYLIDYRYKINHKNINIKFCLFWLLNKPSNNGQVGSEMFILFLDLADLLFDLSPSLCLKFLLLLADAEL